MQNNFSKIRNFLFELEISIISEDEKNQTFVIQKEDDGVMNMIIAIADPILILEQQLFSIKNNSDNDLYKTILKKNRDIIHGAMVLDDTEKNIIYRDTLEIENLDLNELEASIESLSLLLSEFGEIILKYAK